MWTLRRYYAGGQGALPPTDPRIHAMTPLQVEIEFAHMHLDSIEAGNGTVYQDDGYEDYEKEVEENDNRLSDMPAFGDEASDPFAGQVEVPKTAEIMDEDEWEEVEIDPLPPTD